MAIGVCYVNMQNLKFRSWRGTEIDAVKVEASFSKIGLRQVKKFSFFLLFWLATSSKSRWNLDEISRRFRGDFDDWPFQIWKFSSLPIRRKMTFSKIDLFTSEKWKCTGVNKKRGEILRFLMFFRFRDKIKRKCSTIEMIFGGYIKDIMG